MVEWTQCAGDRPHRPVEPQQSYETEWDMINTVSYKRKPNANGEGECRSANRPTMGGAVGRADTPNLLVAPGVSWISAPGCLREVVHLLQTDSLHRVHCSWKLSFNLLLFACETLLMIRPP